MSSISARNTTKLLIIEDNPIDVRLLRYAFSQEKDWALELSVLDDGAEAFAHLESCEAELAPIPDFVILDLNLPKRDGTEILEKIRTSPRLRNLPVAIVSSSPMDAIRGRVNAANVSANCYFVKPMNVDEFVSLGRELRSCYEGSSWVTPKRKITGA